MCLKSLTYVSETVRDFSVNESAKYEKYDISMPCLAENQFEFFF